MINEKVTTGKGGGEDELQDGWGGGCSRKGGVGQYNGRRVTEGVCVCVCGGGGCKQNTDNVKYDHDV